MLPKDLILTYSLRDLLTTENWRIPQSARTPLPVPAKILVLEDDWDTADRILVSGEGERAGKFKYYIPEEALASTPGRNAQGYVCEYEFVNGSLIRMDTEKSFINDPNSFEGDTNDVIHYDEGKKRALRVALKRGLADRYGYEIFTLTPLCEPWIYHEVHKRCWTDPNYSEFFFDTDDLIKAGFVSQEGWDEFVSTMTEDEKEARAQGKWVFLKGLVYPEFTPKLYKDGGNLCEPIDIDWVAKNGSVYVAIDPHSRQPLTALILVADNKGRLILWKEIFKKCMIDEFCDLLKAELMYMGTDKDGKPESKMLPVVRYIIDPIAFIEDPVSGLTWADEFNLHDIPVEEAPKNRAQGILACRQAFNNPKTKDRRLVICTNCTETLREIQLYVYQEWKAGDRSEKEKPVDKDDHMMECMYRLVVGDPQYYDMATLSRPLNIRDLTPKI